ncbi:methyltransferase domain-containing protein [Glycomyces sp. TRM65418]|uniref:class I SAM-dependent methyltransferase n=1 Tax=Glycomyces sp. TRM65418 TaxID=2867006 RepID=UPI001CE61D1C|nr:class I SAM-dependent methyltransferase [Glycomyces sp. TRM65418]MCC3763679.1 methyltransferase domain-containing protein [Glycomyces sp. TRM65418]QZD57659.1 methyltransferase domain-containing protein [Glycomyces sp. TRM65418]
MDHVETSLLEALRADPGLQRRAAEALREHGDRAPLTLRKAGVAPELAAAALTLADLRAHATAKLGERAERLYFTRPGLEQATRWAVAERRAARFARAVDEVTDLCCGVGTDALAFAEAGLRVAAVDRSEATAAYARANAAATGLDVDVRVDDALTTPLGAAVFADPARRAGGTRNFNPAEYSPPLDDLLARLDDVRFAAVKLGPGIKHEWLPEGAEAEWVSVDRDVVEACLWLGEAAAAPRRASVCKAGEWHELTGSGRERAAVGDVARYLYEPDGAVIRAGLVAELAAGLEAHTASEHIAYLYGDALRETPFARAWKVEEVWPLHPKKLRALLAERGIGRLTIKQRGTGIDPAALRKQLKLKGANEATLVATRIGEAHAAILCSEA